MYGGAVADRQPSGGAFGTADPTRMEQFHGKGIRADAADATSRWIQGRLQRYSLLLRTWPTGRLRSISAVFRHRVQYERSMECAGR